MGTVDAQGNLVVEIGNDLYTFTEPKGRHISQLQERAEGIKTAADYSYLTMSVLSVDGHSVEHFLDMDAVDLKTIEDEITATFRYFRKKTV
jgi:hypothetical protein